MEYPLVTVFTLIYNTNPRYVIEAIESVRDNNYPNIQHIIIDDCSPDTIPKETVKVWIEKEKYPCEFYEHKINFGICKTLNHVLELAKGKYILPCGDDLLHRDMISSLISVLEDKNLDVLFSRTNVYENGEFKYIFPAEEHIVNFEKIKNNYESLLIKNILPAIGTIYKTEILRRIGGYDEDLKYEDLDMHIRLIQNKYKYFFHLNSYSDYFIRSTGYSKSHSYLISRQKVLVKYKHFQTFNLAYRQWLKSVFFQNSQLVKFVDFSEHPNLIFRYFFTYFCVEKTGVLLLKILSKENKFILNLYKFIK